MTCWHALWLCGSRWNSTSDLWNKFSDSCIDELQWSSLHTRRCFSSICLTHDSYFAHYYLLQTFSVFFCHQKTTTYTNISFHWNAIPAHILWLSNRTAFWSALHKFCLVFVTFPFVILQLCLLYILCVCCLCLGRAHLHAGYKPSVYPRVLTKLIANLI